MYISLLILLQLCSIDFYTCTHHSLHVVHDNVVINSPKYKSAAKQNVRTPNGSIGTTEQNQNPFTLHKGCCKHVSVQDGF